MLSQRNTGRKNPKVIIINAINELLHIVQRPTIYETLFIYY